jgi:Ras-related protein Rab-5C
MSGDLSSPAPIRLVLLGNAGVGKSSIYHHILGDSFDEIWQSTIGSPQSNVTVVIDGRSLTFTLIDTAGQERFHSVTTFTYRYSRVAFLVFDLQDEGSMRAIAKWKEQLGDVVTDSPDIYVLGNKADLELFPEWEQVIIDYCNDEELQYMRVSAKTGQGLGDLMTTVGTKVLERNDLFQEEKVKLEERGGTTVSECSC